MRPKHGPQFFRLYGDWFDGFSEIPLSLAFARTASSVRPSLRPITRVGVFPCASCRRSDTCCGVQGFPVFLVDFDIPDSSAPAPTTPAVKPG